MDKPFIYLNRPFRDQYYQEISEIAPDYQITTELHETNADKIEIAVGWPKNFQDQLLSPYSKLKWVQAISAGVDTLPLADFNEKEILLSNGSGIHATSISEHVLAVLLAHFRGIDTAIKNQEKQTWAPEKIHYRQLADQKMLIVGTGKIGQQLAELAAGLGVKVYGINTTGHPVAGFSETYAMQNLPKIISGMDIVIDILPETKETNQVFKKTLFDFMKEGTVFVNVGRGKTVVQTDLVQALSDGILSFAAIDVFPEEPLPSDSPLWSVPNLLITPHISGMTPNFQEKFMAIFLKNLKNYVAKKQIAINQVNLQKGY